MQDRDATEMVRGIKGYRLLTRAAKWLLTSKPLKTCGCVSRGLWKRSPKSAYLI